MSPKAQSTHFNDDLQLVSETIEQPRRGEMVTSHDFSQARADLNSNSSKRSRRA